MTRLSNILAACSAVSVSCLALPAAAISTVAVVNGSCISVTNANGCLFTGNIAPSTYATTQTAYNTYNNTHPLAGPDITLVPLFKSDDAGFPGSLTGGTGASGTWSTPGYAVNFLAVKASNYFVLYEFTSPVSSGNWTTQSIPHNGGLHALSHLAFFGAATPAGGSGSGGGGSGSGSGGGGGGGGGTPPGVPEPASWALMLGGFGLVGGLMRRRTSALHQAIAA